MKAAKTRGAKKTRAQNSPNSPKKSRAKKSRARKLTGAEIDKVIEEAFPETAFTHPGLDERECKAVEYIASGMSYTNVCRFVKIDRKTLYNWRKKAVFQRALEARISDEDGDLRAEAHVMARKARETLRAAFERQSPQDAMVAQRFLEKTGLLYRTDESKETDKLMQEAAAAMSNLMVKYGLEPAN